jgi:hypothetical protein
MLVFCALLLFLLGLPVILYKIGLPSREQAWSGSTYHAGAVGDTVRTIYDDHEDVDVLFVGPSILRRGVMEGPIQDALSEHLGRPAHVALLSMVWPGADLQYFMLRDYLDRHHPKLIVWNVPGPVSNSNEPHIQAYRWMRYGEYKNAFEGLPLRSRIQVYGEMVLGAPRELLYKLRPNLISAADLADPNGEDVHDNINTGYHKAAFVPDSLPIGTEPTAELLPVTSPVFRLAGTRPQAYQLKYLRGTMAVANKKDCAIVLLHIPTDTEYGESYIPEITNWSKLFGPQYEMIGIPAATLFAGMDKERYLHFFSDNHLNTNGRKVFTRAIIPPVLEAYDKESK